MTSAHLIMDWHVVHLQAVLFALFAAVVCWSYQSIPNTYERLAALPAGSSTFLSIMRSLLGRTFIRWCGVDHVIMAFAMAMVWVGFIPMTDNLRWVLVVSEGGVALVSWLSAHGIKSAAKGVV